MLQFIIIAEDGTDEEAYARRMAVRPTHLAVAGKLKANNNYISGGAMLDEADKMTGSVMIVQFATEAELKHWLDNEPYITGNVWKTIQVKPFRVAEIV